jgi:internalin A
MTENEAYRNAEEKIEEALRSGAKKLDLRGSYREDSSKLTEVPGSLRRLPDLESLNLSLNRLSTLPVWLTNLTHLRTLNLYGNQLSSLPQSLTQLTQLESLDLSNNKLTSSLEPLGHITRLKSLILSGNHLSSLPQSLTQLTHLEALDLSNNKLTELPELLSHLTQLKSLILSRNELSSLPQSLTQLTHLESLHLSNNKLTALPESISQFMQLHVLNVSQNQLTLLPASLGELKQLQELDVSNNRLTILPESLGQLAELESLDIWSNEIRTLPLTLRSLKNLVHFFLDNPLDEFPEVVRELSNLVDLGAARSNFASVPDWLGELAMLEKLHLFENRLTDLPTSIAQLERLKQLSLSENPLNPELAAADKEGVEAVQRYLRELAKGAKRRYEAKLLILGDGNEGKTCVSRAIRGLPFQPQVTTRGVDVEQWKFRHPDHAVDRDKQITLNIWDFEGQEINHQTHQFFLTTQSLYILVFKCRDQFPMDRAEYWLDTIRARAPQAKVAIVISESEKRTPYVPQDKLQAQYGDLLAGGTWLFAVGCEDNSGVVELQNSLKRWAADLEFMGREWPESYSKAEEAIKGKAKEGAAHIGRSQLYEIFRVCGIDESIFKDLAGSMSTLGVMTQFPDCPDLRDFIVLQPQWLTKAISEIMEDKQLASDKGEIALQRMEHIWEDKAYMGLFTTFHDCMKEFELCYDLEDASRSCLVPLRFGYEKPKIPWSEGDSVKERRVEYKLNIRPPMGLMSRFIVKTHHMMVTTAEHPKGVYWHNGVFLRTGAGPLASEALCEFDGDARKLRIQVRAAFPQNLLEQIHGYVRAVFSFFTGLEAQRSYGCIKIDERTDREEKCIGAHSESRIYSAIRKQRVLDCEYEFHDVDPQKLIWGFSSFGEYVMAKVASIDKLREELDKKPDWAEGLTQDIGTLLGWVEDHRERMNQLVDDQANLIPEIKQQLELKLHEYLAHTSGMLDAREDRAAPGIISISTRDRSKWNPAAYFKKTYFLTPFCENAGNIHPCEDGRVEFTKDREWWERTSPWIARGTKLLAVGLQLAFAGMPLALGHQVFDAIKDDVNFMRELTKHMELKADNEGIGDGADVLERDFDKDLRGTEKESRLMRAALSRFLEETAPNNYRARQWGSLRRVRMSDNSYRWLCEAHAN